MMPQKETLIPFTDIESDFQLMYDAYHGVGGFKSGAYLAAFPRETLEKYLARQKIAYYTNYTKPVINSLVDPVFRNPVVRQLSEDDMLQRFIEDADTNGTSIDDFMKQVALSAKTNTVCFVVVDNFPEEEQPPNMQGVMEKRVFPYAYMIERNQIKEWEVNKSGRLKRIVYEVFATRANGDALTHDKEKWTWTETEISVIKTDGTEEKKPNNLGVVPVIPVYGRKVKPGDIMPEFEMLQVAKTNMAIYNHCSELQKTLRDQAFSVLTYPVGTESGQDSEEVAEAVTGTETMLTYDGGLSNKPEFITPPADQVTAMQAELARLVQEIYRMSGLESVTGVQTKESGVAKEWDYEQTNNALADLANNLEDAERKIFWLFILWTKRSVKEISIKYPDNFGISDIGDKITEASQALALGIGGEFNAEVKKQIASILFKDLPDERIKQILDSIDEQQALEEKAKEQALAVEGNGGGFGE